MAIYSTTTLISSTSLQQFDPSSSSWLMHEATPLWKGATHGHSWLRCLRVMGEGGERGHQCAQTIPVFCHSNAPVHIQGLEPNAPVVGCQDGHERAGHVSISVHAQQLQSCAVPPHCAHADVCHQVAPREVEVCEKLAPLRDLHQRPVCQALGSAQI
eukprot:CAMPEP_0198703536 /NCGR_PEP_ID=MMETSP1468-20131203/389395_1 /TAXON_ID=1461545 /ORGANISM="Mantoniella sp, Strain CCMP1436" /LENGTH=156 /DNA_ID=CAMNT_0044462241 /DNA_START=1005 /DNA_END=1475 /DNA_ORIENTATION=-